MKKTAIVLALLAWTTSLWAQEAPVAPPSADELQAAIDSVDQKTVGLFKAGNANDDALALRITGLEGRLKFGGYLGAAMEYKYDTDNLGFYDASPENTRFRLNADYTDKNFGIKTRIQYRLLKEALSVKGTTFGSLNADLAAAQFVDVAYLNGYVRLFDMVELNAGKILVADYAQAWAWAGNAGAGYYEGNSGIHISVNPLDPWKADLKWADTFKVGVFLPVALPSINGTTGVESKTTTMKSQGLKVDLNATYRIKGLFDFNAGLLGQDFYNNGSGTGNSAGTFSDYTKTSETANINTAYFGVVYNGLNLLVPEITASIGAQALFAYEYLQQAPISTNINSSITLEAFGVKIFNEFASRIPTATGTFKTTYLNEDKVSFQDTFNLSYKFAAVDGKTLDLEPALQVRYESAPNNTKDAAKVLQSFNPRLKFLVGKQEWLIGADWITCGSDATTANLIDTVGQDNTILRFHTSYKINF